MQARTKRTTRCEIGAMNDELDEITVLEFTEVLAVPVEDGSLSVHQLPTSHIAQSDKSTAGSVSEWTQTAFEQMSQPSIPKHQPEYGPYKRFSRKEKEEILYTEELGHWLVGSATAAACRAMQVSRVHSHGNS